MDAWPYSRWFYYSYLEEPKHHCTSGCWCFLWKLIDCKATCIASGDKRWPTCGRTASDKSLDHLPMIDNAFWIIIINSLFLQLLNHFILLLKNASWSLKIQLNFITVSAAAFHTLWVVAYWSVFHLLAAYETWDFMQKYFSLCKNFHYVIYPHVCNFMRCVHEVHAPSYPLLSSLSPGPYHHKCHLYYSWYFHCGVEWTCWNGRWYWFQHCSQYFELYKRQQYNVYLLIQYKIPASDLYPHSISTVLWNSKRNWS